MAPDTTRRLNHQDLVRFEETIKPPFRRALECGRVDLLPPPAPDPEAVDPLARAVGKGRAVFDERAGRLVVPLIEGGQCLGLAVAWGVEAQQLSPQVAPFLNALVETALEMVRQRLAAETDPVTGLMNEAALDEELTRALAALTPAKVRGRPAMDRARGEKGLSLIALEPQAMATLLESYGRRFGDQLLAEMARRVGEAAPGAAGLARVGGAILVLMAGGAGPARDVAGRIRRALAGLEMATPGGGAWQGPVRMGAAAVDAKSHKPGGLAAEAAVVLKGRALRALSSAARVGLDEVLFFGEIVDKAGRLSEVLPHNQVRLDLGQVHGLVEGERFQVMDPPGQGGEARPKAEVLVAAMGEEESLAEVVALYQGTAALRPGDRLRRLGPEAASAAEPGSEETVTVGGQEVRVLLDGVTGLASHRSFGALFKALSESQPAFAAALIRVEGLEGMREELGRVGADALMRSVAGLARQTFPDGVLLGRFAPDTLAALLPGDGAEEAAAAASGLISAAAGSTQRALRAGVAAQPTPGSEAGDVLDNAAKALVHAGFLEAGAVVPFDAISLNISGDALFAQGRIAEAVAEYERGLLLNDAEPNLLNSLGVCYGHLGQMDKAMGYFERAMAASPDDFMACYNLGYALMAQGRLGEARQRLEQGLALKPDHADTLLQLGRLAQGEGRLAEALDLFTRAAAQPDCMSAVHRHLGEALAAAGELGRAEEAYKHAVKAKPNDAGALASLAELYLHRGANLEIALSLAKRAAKLEPGAARHLRVTAAALTALERLDEAGELLAAAVAAHAQDPFLAMMHARLLARTDREALARDEFMRALSLEPNLEEARSGLAELEARRAAAEPPEGDVPQEAEAEAEAPEPAGQGAEPGPGPDPEAAPEAAPEPPGEADPDKSQPDE